MIRKLIVSLCLVTPCAMAADVSQDDLVRDSPSADSSGSMPPGAGRLPRRELHDGQAIHAVAESGRLLVPAPADAQPPEHLGNPIRQVYGENAGQKREIWALRAFEGRIYLAHGTSDTTIQNRVIYLDPGTGQFDIERKPDGAAVLMNAEVIRWARVFDGQLFFGNYDPIHGNTLHYRRIDGQWHATDTGKDQHSRDFYKFDGRLFTYAGYTGSPRPHIMISDDDGASWRPIRQPELPDALRPAWCFAEFDGQLYSLGDGRNVLRYRPEDQTFQPLFDARSDWLDQAEDTGLLFLFTSAFAFKDRLLVSSGPEVWSVSSMRPGVDPAVNPRVGLPEGLSVSDLASDGTTLFMLGNIPEAQGDTRSHRHVVLASDDGLSFREVLRFQDQGSADRASAIEVHAGTLYIARHGGDVFAVPLLQRPPTD
jgi:hypothetical protein